MTIRNDEIAAQFEELADLLEAHDVAYKPAAYRRAAEHIREHPENIATLARERGTDAVERIDRVGEAIASKITEYVDSGEIDELVEQREQLPVDMAGLTSVEGVGPKTVGSLYEALGVQTLDELEAAAKNEQIRTVSGFGPKTEQNILGNIDFARQSQKRQLLSDAVLLGATVTDHLDSTMVERCEVAGSLRRFRPTIGDVDVLVASTDPQAVVDAFTGWPDTDRVIESGTSKASVRADDVRVDLRVVNPTEFGGALQYFTGSKDHNIELRNRAIERDMKVNEYGVFDISGVDDPDTDQRAGERIAGETEREVYDALGLPLIPPELREGRGEIDAAATGELPDLITTDAMRGDLHLHTEWSDGKNTVEEMVEGAIERGYDYVCITDHATGPGMVGGVGLTDDQLEEQLATVREVDDDAEIHVFAGVEANIGTDGEISVDDALLERLDCVVASPHAALDGDGTDRLITAAKHPEVNIIGHPTGRMLNRRPGLDIDTTALAEHAAAAGTALEINANPHRLDLRGGAVKAAIDAGTKITINTDAHRPQGYDYVSYGVHTARRGWAEPNDVLNTWSVDDLRDFLHE